MSGSKSNGPNIYALLIGVDCYLPNQLPDGGYYPSLGGCVRDVSHVEDYLKKTFGLAGDRIIKLTATNTGGNKPQEPPGQWPTYENMVAAFKGVTEMANPGDHVFIHYSGHGGRANTIYSRAKGPDGLDEALVPTDIGNSEARYLRDLELVKLLNDMVAKGLVVVGVIDACHSGGMTRGRADVAIRGINSVDTSPRPADSLVASEQELLQVWDEATGGGTRSVALGSGWLPEPKGYTLLAACRPSESAFEYAFNGRERNGALTYWLLDSLEDGGPGLSYKVLHDQIVAKVHSQFENQTPQLQGEGDRIFLGSKRIQPHYAVTVMQVDRAGKRVLLGAGQSHGLREGVRFAVYPPGADFMKIDLRQAIVELAKPGSTDSWATIIERFGQKDIEQGAQAVILGAGSVRTVQKVSLQHGEDVPAGIDQDVVFQAARNAISSTGWVQAAEPGDQVDYSLTINSKGEYEIWDRTGQAIANLRPPIGANAEGAAFDVARRLVHMAKYNAVKQLSNYDPSSPLARKVEVGFIGRRTEYDPADPFEPEQAFTEIGHTPSVKVGEWTALRIRNNASRNLNITVLDLQPDWGITQIYPSGPGDHFVELEAGQEVVIPLQVALPDAYETGKDVVKVFATVSTTNFRWFELPALDQPLKRSTEVATKNPANSLELMAAAFTADQPLTRTLVPTTYPSREWTTVQVEIQIVKT